MLKKSALKRILISSLALIIMFLFCIFPKEDELLIPEEVVYVSELTMPIYATHKKNYVARGTIIKNKDNDDEIKYIIEALTVGTEASNYLSEGFLAIIPRNTKIIDYTVEDKILKINFTKEFLNVTPGYESKMLESLVFSLCELEGIAGIIIYVENTHLDQMPNTMQKLPMVLDRNIGINRVYSIDNIKGTSMSTIYYMAKENESYYYVPISKITSNEIEPVEIIIKEMRTAPIYETNLISYLNASYELQGYEILENSISLSFNNTLIAGLNDSDINEQVKYTLALSLRDTYNIDDILININ